MEGLGIIFGFLLGLISSLIVFYFSERSRVIKKQKEELHFIYLKLYEIVDILICLESSSQQYLLGVNFFKNKSIKSISFPSYIAPNIEQYIPSGLYHSDESFLRELIQVNAISKQINNLSKGSAINEIKHDYLNEIINFNETLQRYMGEEKYIQSYLKSSESYIEYIFHMLGKIYLINKQKPLFFGGLKINFSESDIMKKTQETKEKYYNNHAKIEDYKI